MSAALQARIVAEFGELEALAGDWARLVASHPRSQVFHELAWQRATWAAYGDQRRLCTAVVSAGTNVVGILPLARLPEGVRFAAVPHADYCDLLCEPERAGDVLLAALVALHRHGVRRVLFQHLPPDSLLLRARDQLPQRWRRRLLVQAGDPCPTFLAAKPADFQPIVDKQSLRRHERGLQRLGPVVMLRHRDRASAERELPQFFAQHKARRVCAGDQSLFLQQRSQRFYAALLHSFDPATQLHFVQLRCGDTAVAYHFGFLRDARFTWYKPTIHVDYWDEGPGEVMIKRLMEEARDTGVVEFDFARGDEAFKRRFSNHDRPNRHLLLLAPGLRGAIESAILLLAAAVRRRPRLHALARRGRDALQQLTAACRRHGPLRVVLRLLHSAARAAVYARDEAIVFHRQARTAPQLLAERGLRLAAGRLSELAGCAVRYPEHFDGRRMQQARRRLKDGDQLQLAFVGDEVVHVAWLGQRQEIVASSEVGTQVTVPLPATATVVYDCWTPPPHRGQGVYPAVLSNLQPLAAGQELWIYCHARNVSSARGIQKAGFVLAERLGRVVWFGRFRSSWRRRPGA
ncbi:MAG TPA: GNAT family N-acetyltransferase [Planctomycetota bacterium]